MGSFSIPVRPVKVLVASLVIILLLSLANAATLVLEYGYGYDHAKGVVPKFRLNAESNLPTFYSTLLLLGASLSALMVAMAARARTQQLFRNWLAISLVALFLAVDEASRVHELFDEYEGWTGGLVETTGFLDGPWVIAYGLLVLVTVAFFWRFFFGLAMKYKIIFGAASLLYVGGAIGFEMIGAAELTVAGESLRYEMINSTEEMMEMTGVTVAIYGILDYLRKELGWEAVGIAKGEAPAAAAAVGREQPARAPAQAAPGGDTSPEA